MTDQRTAIADRMPRDLTIETTSRCQLRCVMCPHAIGAVRRPGHFPDELLPRLGNALDVAERVQLHGIGEPLLSPAFWAMLDRLPTTIMGSVNTNLAVRNDELVLRLARSRLRKISVSLDAATAPTYRDIRGFDFDVVTENVRLLAANRPKNHSLSLNMTIMRRNAPEIPEFVRLAHSLGVRIVQFWHLNRLPDRAMAEQRVQREGWLFDYAEQGLWDEIAETRELLEEAKQVAAGLKMKVKLDQNKEI